MKNSEYNKALDTAKKFCSKSEKCSFDVLKKLEYSKISNQQKLSILKILKDENFIDEERYTKAFVNDKFKFNKWGKIKIFNSLKLKKIPENIIYKYLNLISEEEYIETLVKLIKEKTKIIKEQNVYKKKAKLYRFAISRGFENDFIMKIIINF